MCVGKAGGHSLCLVFFCNQAAQAVVSGAGGSWADNERSVGGG